MQHTHRKKQERKQPLVSKEFLLPRLKANPNLVIGRILVAIYNNQTSAEQNAGKTRVHNGIGFTQSDARVGTMGAKYYKETGVLPPWQINIWTSLNKKGEPRILKYANQLNDLAIYKQQKANEPNEKPAASL